MEPLAGMLFGVVSKPATAGVPTLRREPVDQRPPTRRRREQITLLTLYPHRRGL